MNSTSNSRRTLLGMLAAAAFASAIAGAGSAHALNAPWSVANIRCGSQFGALVWDDPTHGQVRISDHVDHTDRRGDYKVRYYKVTKVNGGSPVPNNPGHRDNWASC